ncbi:MAG: hypothetical protein QME44_03890, partial [Thermodesulfobacteriota bacterium]|nr:hypothetical protein [Thermodesulfobacteriota bacterium]
ERHELMISQRGTLTFEEFKEKIARSGESRSLMGRASDRYDKIPSLIRTIQNIDPTGIAGAIDQALSDNKARREQENIMRALYALYKAICYLGSRQTEIEYNYQGVSDLTYLYFEKSQESYDDRKIEYYKNIWMNGLISSEETLEEKAYVFNVVSSLSVDEISVLSHMAKKQMHIEFQKRQPVTVDDVAQELNVSSHLSQQLCIGLAGKGLLHDHGLGRFDYKGPVNFVITDYVKLISKYLTKP